MINGLNVFYNKIKMNHISWKSHLIDIQIIIDICFNIFKLNYIPYKIFKYLNFKFALKYSEFNILFSKFIEFFKLL